MSYATIFFLLCMIFAVVAFAFGWFGNEPVVSNAPKINDIVDSITGGNKDKNNTDTTEGNQQSTDNSGSSLGAKVWSVLKWIIIILFILISLFALYAFFRTRNPLFTGDPVNQKTLSKAKNMSIPQLLKEMGQTIIGKQNAEKLGNWWSKVAKKIPSSSAVPVNKNQEELESDDDEDDDGPNSQEGV